MGVSYSKSLKILFDINLKKGNLDPMADPASHLVKFFNNKNARMDILIRECTALKADFLTIKERINDKIGISIATPITAGGSK